MISLIFTTLLGMASAQQECSEMCVTVDGYIPTDLAEMVVGGMPLCSSDIPIVTCPVETPRCINAKTKFTVIWNDNETYTYDSAIRFCGTTDAGDNMCADHRELYQDIETNGLVLDCSVTYGLPEEEEEVKVGSENEVEGPEEGYLSDDGSGNDDKDSGATSLLYSLLFLPALRMV